jgi:hypothetical protein
MFQRRWIPLTATLLALAFAHDAAAAGPGSADRRRAAGSLCVGGTTPGESCGTDLDCGGLAQCALIDIDALEVRGMVTFVADKDTGGPNSFGAPTPVVVGDFGTGEQVQLPADFARSSLAVVIEFTKDGQDFIFADTYNDVDFPVWVVPGGEWIIARAVLDLRWGTGGDDLSIAIANALGAPPGSTAYVQTFRDVTLPPSADQAEAGEVLASVRRYKVTIGVVPPPPSP